MSLTVILAAMASAFLSATASISIREAALGHVMLRSMPSPIGPLSDFYLLAIVAYGTAFIAYAIALRQVSPAVAYPMIVGGTYLFTVLASWLLTRENLPLQALIGGAFVLMGITIVVSSKAS
ncbi:MAG: hypothetical protein Q8M88_03825 [Phenylobacterium sp.]|uniref:hypothetical protein n=1 Tax=Phenylobacterium sp. TaxID=1871053 RepID=UPI002736BE89|nr:hypothetical protein [Phenylobacterium sp.]MDP3173544.1 hypothetical protein [Phenylobacterium sp.]